MNEQMFFNSKPRCTLIKAFDGTVIVVGPNGSVKLERKSLSEAGKEIEKRGWTVGVFHPTRKEEEKQ